MQQLLLEDKQPSEASIDSNSYNQRKDSSTIPSYLQKSTTGKSASGESSDKKTFQLNAIAVSERLDVKTNSGEFEEQSKPNTQRIIMIAEPEICDSFGSSDTSRKMGNSLSSYKNAESSQGQPHHYDRKPSFDCTFGLA